MIEKVNKKIYYHINTGKKLNAHDVLNIGDRYNNFYYEIYNSEYLLEEKDANEILINKRKNKDYIINDIEEFKLVYETINNSAMITRELIFEEVRKEVNSELPSRLKCLYVCNSLEEIEEWLNIFKRTNKKDYQILELELTGKVFTGDASYILRQNISLNKKREQAKEYWNGNKINNHNETLFEGTAVVRSIIK